MRKGKEEPKKVEEKVTSKRKRASLFFGKIAMKAEAKFDALKEKMSKKEEVVVQKVVKPRPSLVKPPPKKLIKDALKKK